MKLPRWPRSARNAPAPVAGAIYAVGDIHGQADKFYELTGLIERDLVERGQRQVKLIVLGDFIDRGPGSRRLIDLFMRLRGNDRVTVLKGNHEAALVAGWRGDHNALSGWYANGGDATLRSYGIDTAQLDPCDSVRIYRATKGAIPADVIDWLNSLRVSLQIGNYYFVHAGVRPGIGLDQQNEEDCLWIREDFTRSNADHGAVIVHGHTVSRDGIGFFDNRIGVDTGAYMTGQLSAVVIADGTVSGITTSPWSADDS